MCAAPDAPAQLVLAKLVITSGAIIVKIGFVSAFRAVSLMPAASTGKKEGA
jgi:hypothetical protein